MSLDARNAELEKKLEHNPVDDAIASLIKADHHRKQQIFWLAASIVFDLVLTVALAFGWQSNHKLALQAESNRNAIIRRCEATNTGRANNKEIWGYLLAQTANQPPQSPEQQAFRAKFEQKINETFMPDDCSKVVDK